MNINWIVTPHYCPQFDMQQVAPVWGSDTAWHKMPVDNVICYDFDRAFDLISRNAQVRCNLWLPEKHFANLDRPAGINLFGGKFAEQVIYTEEIVAMHLVASSSDIVLLAGFDLSDSDKGDEFDDHLHNNYLKNVKRVIAEHADTQWVLLDHKSPKHGLFDSLPNLLGDSSGNVKNTLSMLV